MARLVILLLCLIPVGLFAQGNGASGDGGPAIVLNSVGSEGRDYGEHSNTVTGDGGPMSVLNSIDMTQIYTGINGTADDDVTNNGNPYDAYIAAVNGFKPNRELIVGGDGGGGVHGINMGFNPTLNRDIIGGRNIEVNVGSNVMRFVDSTSTGMGFDAINSGVSEAIVARAQAIAESRGLIFPVNAPKIESEFELIGDVVDMETTEFGLVDLETLRDLKPNWLKERDGKIWLKKDAPVVNYQRDNGEVIDFGFGLERDDD
jgi:hypothetical protein